MKKRTFTFRPTYYEWHLEDNNGNLIHVMADPAEETCYEDGTPYTYDEIKYFCDCDLECAERAYNEEKQAYNGCWVEEKDRLTEEETEEVANIMATALYSYYCVESNELQEERAKAVTQ